MHIVDIHPHVIATDHARYPLAPVGGKLSEWAARRPVTCEQLLAAMDEAGVAQAALVQASTAHGHDNRYSADCAAAHLTTTCPRSPSTGAPRSSCCRARRRPAAGGPVYEAMRRGWGDRELDVPVDTDLGEHLISYLIEHDFDVAHLRRGAERRAHRVSTRSRVPA